MTAARLHFTAGEPSGDVLGAEVIEHVRRIAPGVDIAGIGGSAMASAGAASEIDIAPLSVLGFFEGARAYPTVVRLADAAAREIAAFRPDAAVLIDSWGFSLRVARRLRRLAPEIRLIKLVGPQVWATRPGRAKTLAQAVDHLLCIHAFETPYYEPHGLKTTVIGNPALSRAPRGDGPSFLRFMGYEPDAQVLLLLPGSRESEIKRVAPALVGAAERVGRADPDIRIAALPASNVHQSFIERFSKELSFIDLVPSEHKFDAMAGATAALACSGTVTTELAAQGAPFVVGYKAGPITWALARGFLLRTPYITLLNVAAGREIAPEFLQSELTEENLHDAVWPLLSSPENRRSRIDDQNAALKAMGDGERPAALIAAEAILKAASDQRDAIGV